MRTIDGVGRQFQQNSGNPINHGYIAIPDGVDREAFIETCFRRNRVTVITDYGAVINECYILKNVLQQINFPPKIDAKGSCVCYVCGDFSNKPIVIGVIDENDQSALLNENMFYFSKEMNGTSILIQGDPNNKSLVVNIASLDPANIMLAVKGNEESELNIESSGKVNISSDKEVNIKSFETISGTIVDVEKPDDIHNIVWDKSQIVVTRKTEKIETITKLDDEGINLTIGEDISIEITKEIANIKVGQSTLEMSKDLINFNGGGLQGLVDINKLTTKLNSLVSQINSFVTAYNKHIHPATMGTTSPTASQATPPSTFVKDDYENTKIVQG